MAETKQDEKITKEESERVAGVFFEDDFEVRLRDNKTYFIPPSNLKNARRLMTLLKEVDWDAVMLNFVPTGDEEVDSKRINSLFEILEIAFVNHPQITRDYLEEYVDVITASKIVEALIGLNGLKKSKPQSENQG